MSKLTPTLDTKHKLDSEVVEIAEVLRGMDIEVIIEEYKEYVKFTNVDEDRYSIWGWDEIYKLPWSILICCLIEDLCYIPEECKLN